MLCDYRKQPLRPGRPGHLPYSIGEALRLSSTVMFTSEATSVARAT